MSPQSRHRMQRTALAITRWIGSPQSIALHTAIFLAAIYVLVKGLFTFDVVILVLNTAVSLEAIYLALFIQMTVNYQGASLEEVGEDLVELQEDLGEIQEDVGEIQEDIDELQEDVEVMTVVEVEEEERKRTQKVTLEQIHDGLQKLMQDVERLQHPKP